jgi:hypothetical protein
VYAARDETFADVFDRIKRIYNPRRRQTTPGYSSFVEYKNATARLRAMAAESGQGDNSR